ncbi:hypothetical protein LGT39_04995 [Demequina sp. TTPB684]|uniref:hypothetical protein n=1 Tax=unclassified Demequina TaxID=2620311 RepID=UPI001CF2E1EB|nr:MULTISPECIES: hypothetical protein [unclassified Demequina]MCB2412205.1 hypothetical protein [Demequina sp. TTPB684]UPU87321.1 hypothetical protein LGT36_008525 [Demequina sp. TMPB413]
MRVLGAALTLGIVVIGVGVAALAQRSGPSVTDAGASLSPEEQFQEFKRQNAEAWVADVPGLTIRHVYGSLTHVETAGGGLLTIERVEAPLVDPENVNAESRPLCTWLAYEGDLNEDFDSWCVLDGDLWVRADGTAVAGYKDGSYTIVRSQEASWGDEDGDRPANADEVAEIYASLRPINDADLRAARQHG